MFAKALSPGLFATLVLLACLFIPPATAAPAESRNLPEFNPLRPSEPLLDPARYFNPEEMARWKAYRMAKVHMNLIAVGSVILFYAFLLLLGLNRRLKSLAEKAAGVFFASRPAAALGSRFPRLQRVARFPEVLFGGRQWLVVLLYCLFFFFLLEFCFFPYFFYRSYWYELRNGLSNYTLGLWFADWAKSLVLTTFLDAAMLFGIYGLLQRVGRKWWLLLWVGVSVAILGWVVIQPYRSQIFSRFQPLESGEVRTRLESLAREQGLELEEILVVDASRRTRAVNAYVQGTGPSRRLVLFDNVLEQFTPREIVTIFAHELVHWQTPPGKVWYPVFSLTVLGVLWAAHRILEAGTRWRRLGYATPMDVAGLPVLLATFFVVFALIKPVNLYVNRGRELETDRKALEMVCDPEAYVQVHAKLARLNRQDVDPPAWVVTLFHSHPPFRERLRLAWGKDCAPEPP